VTLLQAHTASDHRLQRLFEVLNRWILLAYLSSAEIALYHAISMITRAWYEPCQLHVCHPLRVKVDGVLLLCLDFRNGIYVMLMTNLILPHPQRNHTRFDANSLQLSPAKFIRTSC